MLFKFVLLGIELNKSILSKAASYCLLSSEKIDGENFVVKSDFVPDIIYVCTIVFYYIIQNIFLFKNIWVQMIVFVFVDGTDP